MKVRQLFLLIMVLFLLASAVTGVAQSGARGRGRSFSRDGELQPGSLPMTMELPEGQYQVTVSADGYRGFSRGIEIEGGETITLNANLDPVTYDLNVDPGIGSAQIDIEGAGQGSGSLQVSLRPGTYTVRITAPGYQSFRTQVTIRGDQTLRPTLQPALASLRVRIPSEMIVGDREDMEDDLEIYVDGQRQGGIRFQVEPGQHVFRIVSGDWAAEGRFSVEAGNDYVLRPRLTLSLE